MSHFWDRVHDLFDTSDGCLEDIEINSLSGNEVESTYAYLRPHSKIVSDDLYFWSKTAQKDLRVDSVENAARLVVSGEADAFRTVVPGLSYNGAVVPNLGIFVFDDSIEPDYRPGPEWGPAGLEALFACLREVKRLAPSAEITLTAGLDAIRERFALALKQYLDENKGRARAS